ncbi:ovarian-specific serine/threonine-protein kinase Lok-like [Vanessa cardui]|uniref:ovarian-specific serine/threonine-protein kinase Lok-like n=1 Tax=Vanessa cardui TaxID=171605 RepID=UPI001F1333D5|nr:ovarian-specific serine/threonine-protein kinase Lok-like [Vanessa cardui]
MGDDLIHDSENTQTQTQNSQVEWSQTNTPSFIPNIWGRLYSTKVSSSGKYCWKYTNTQKPEYYDLINPEFTLGRTLTCTFVVKKDIIKENIIKNVSKQHFIIKRDLSETLSPAIITDLSHNGTFINGVKIGKGKSRVLDDNDEIAVTHQLVKIFLFKDLLKNEQDKVPKEISQKYYISRILGQGACGIVKLVYNKTACTKHAMKVIKKSRLTNGQLNHLNNPAKIMNEINIMKALRHPCIISTEEVFDSCDAVYIVLELMQGGELFDRITKLGKLPERLTKFLFRQMVLAVKYLHSQGITHRDLKPENVLLESKEEETIVKITDFGLSKFVGEDSFMKTMCGTPLYLAPEVLRGNGLNSYGPEVDVWSLGVILFVCLVGYLPFSSDYKEISLRDQILSGKYRFSHSHWQHVSLQAKLLMKKMLTVRVDRRITLEQILNHAWMQDVDIIIRTERLLSQEALKEKVYLTESSTNSDEENINIDNVTVLRLVATGKRALSDSYNSCEPIPKKLRVDYNPQIDNVNDTSSTNSCCSHD